MSWQGHRELVLYQWAGGWVGGSSAGGGSPLAWIPPGSPQRPQAGAYLENSQGKKRLAPEVFILESKTPPPFLEVVLGLLGEWGGVSMG